MGTHPLHARILAALAAGGASTPERLAATLNGSRTLPPYPLNGPELRAVPTPADTVSIAAVRAACRHLIREGLAEIDADTRAARRYGRTIADMQASRVVPHTMDPLALPGTRLMLPGRAVDAEARVRALLPQLRGRSFTAREIAVVARLPHPTVALVLRELTAAGELSLRLHETTLTPLVDAFAYGVGRTIGVLEIYALPDPDLEIFGQAAELFGRPA